MKSIAAISFLLFAGDTAAPAHADNYDHQSNLRGTTSEFEHYGAIDMFDDDIEPAESEHILNRELVAGRSKQWLKVHNDVRKEYHEKYNKTVVLLKWSNSLRREAKIWADVLVKTCVAKASPTSYGFNIAGKQGSAVIRPAQDIMDMWEQKIDLVGKNEAITQVLWRATEYVGCGDAKSTNTTSGKKCTFSICYYARPGNCEMKKYGSANWEIPTMKDTSACKPFCPPEGCDPW